MSSESLVGREMVNGYVTSLSHHHPPPPTLYFTPKP